MKYLNEEQVIAMHALLITETGGLDGLRDHGLLDSALKALFQTYDGNYLYTSLEKIAARLAYGLIMDHPFIDGNKRIGMYCMETFLALNDVYLEITDKQIYNMATAIASGTKNDVHIVDWIKRHKIK